MKHDIINIYCWSSQVVQSTIFHDRDFLTFASPIPAVKPRFFSLLRPFTLTFWILVGISMFALAGVFFTISNVEVNDVKFLEITIVKQFLILFREESLGSVSKNGQLLQKQFGIALVH